MYKRNEEKIFKRLQSDLDYVKSLGYIPLGVFLQGSQNYNLDYEGSDIDTKIIIVPTFEDFCLNRKPVSTTKILPNNEHIDLKDIRLMHECFLKQNVNFLEILFTKYYILENKYKEEYGYLMQNADLIANFNNKALINCLIGMMLEKYKAMEHPYPTLIDKINKYGYDPKQLHHIARCYEFLQRYTSGETFRECLTTKHRDLLVSIKTGKYSLEEARRMADDYIQGARDYDYKGEIFVNTEAKKMLNDILVKVLRKSFLGELMD